MMPAIKRWREAPQLQSAVVQRLRDWGWHSFGGGPKLGYPSHAPWDTPPARGYQTYFPLHGPDDASAVEYIITSAAQAGYMPAMHGEVLRLEYTRLDLTRRDRAFRLGISRRTFSRRLEDAHIWFWQTAQVFDDAGLEWARKG